MDSNAATWPLLPSQISPPYSNHRKKQQPKLTSRLLITLCNWFTFFLCCAWAPRVAQNVAHTARRLALSLCRVLHLFLPVLHPLSLYSPFVTIRVYQVGYVCVLRLGSPPKRDIYIHACTYIHTNYFWDAMRNYLPRAKALGNNKGWLNALHYLAHFSYLVTLQYERNIGFYFLAFVSI